jgi:dipeptidyl aminopeptidase/acylaminoacyl peptidase
MSHFRASLAATALAVVAMPLGAQLRPNHGPKMVTPVSSKPATTYSIADFLSPASPLEVSAARKADRVAWVTYERGMRNIYVAAAPDFKAVRLTNFMNDDGVDVTSVQLSDDGAIATFVRGSAQNRSGWVANPSHDPNGPERAVWAARTDGSGAWRVAVLTGNEITGRNAGPTLSPDGKYVAFVKDGQIYRARTARGANAPADSGGVAFIREWGAQSDPKWSPDGTKLAFVSTRENHALLGVYDMKTRTVNFLAPSVDFDNDPEWSADGKQVAFVRRPGTPFGQQTQAGNGGIGNPAAPGAAAAGRGGRGGAPAGGGRGGRGNDTIPVVIDGLHRAAFPGGYTISLMIADVASGKAREVWHNQPNDRTFATINNIMWTGDHFIFGGTPPNDEWDRYYSVDMNGPQASIPTLLTTTDGLINDSVDGRTFVTTALSRDGKTFYYCTNAKDIEKRHIWAVPVTGGTPRQISTDDGVEVSPTPLASGKNMVVLYFNAKQPASIGVVPMAGGSTKIVYPTLPKSFPQDAHVVPQIIITHAADGLEIHNQLFLPKDMKPGERRPAIVFVHGGPSREMLPAYHYMQFYHWAYAYNQWLQSQGYIVMSINYRSGVGYGRSFQRAQNTEARGNAEYQDVVAGAKYLQGRADVDPARVGIWGLSYGGLLTAEALSRNSDIFVAGVDLAGVHLYGASLDSTNLAYQSSAASHIGTWKSPVFLEQGDDDRNVNFSQMIGMVDLLRAHGVYYELTVEPDDVHESLVHSRWVDIFNRSSDFLHRFVWEKQAPPVMTSTVKSGGKNK